ncbi:histone deacetylase and transcriptional regulator [Yamadazyma tenuis]|uniref:Transcriptional regulatory protein SDS3 n=1 Tax=Candida tenuis (strain ATCC 10573 / BCRC 21748 / CBS 615 / JCM 9827 / NBRC 10315 / NRRL Y-1498 / VKM Y-70) TaxID=590646 RepID=G3BFI8_CANTC|nr:uncharacterized protein CANTEDRAFT_111670 [Yamadazyma tenuis ATCC 10573]EGV60701.1 hypothetical protein CANTEDRAFT_111670 [Yamadazyma tenuis ATCC 10573]WEJ94034.1 histone deacetylase and transcriptional regulator [Yamadazyma tenuis]
MDTISKKDKRRHQIVSRLSKLDSTLMVDRDSFYRVSLHNLQTTLATLQQGTNPEFLAQKQQVEVSRDFDLTQLRLWEEYQVKRCEVEYKADLATAKENHDKMIRLLKEKLYDKLQKEIKQLKEDKLLLNLVNANSWSAMGHDANTAALNAVAGHALTGRRSLRKRELSSRFTPGEKDDLSDGGGHSAGYTSTAGKRQRHYATRYSSNDEMSSAPPQGYSHAHSKLNQQHTSGMSSGSGNDSNLSDKDYDALNSIIMNNELGGTGLILADPNTHSRAHTRAQHKQFVGVQGLKPEELNDDLSMLRNAIVKKGK